MARKKKQAKKAASKARKKGSEAAAEAPAAPEDEPAPETPQDDLLSILEAMLFASHEPLPLKRLVKALGKVRRERVEAGLSRLQDDLDARRAPLQLVELAGGFRLVTRPEYAPYLARLFHKGDKERLTPAALETLAIIAYRQPATRADIEAIRGVQAGPAVRTLQERRLIKVVGRAPVVGRPLQYGTTPKFLDHFGLGSLEDLPAVLSRDGNPLGVPDMSTEEIDPEALAEAGAEEGPEDLAEDAAAEAEGAGDAQASEGDAEPAADSDPGAAAGGEEPEEGRRDDTAPETQAALEAAAPETARG